MSGAVRAALLVGVAVAGLTAVLTGALTPPSPATSGSRSAAATVADIPPAYRVEYQAAAATCPGLDWSVLAAIGKVESDHGRSRLPGVRSGANPAGARGPMQFLPATFAAYGHGNPYNPHDAIHAAANYLCATGARHGRDLPAAIYAYNHSHAYVTTVLTQARAYRTTGATP